MPWELIFKIAYILPLPFWLLLAFGPRSETTAKIVLYGGILPLALAYMALFLSLLSGTVDAAGPPDTAPMDLTTLSGVMAFFDSKGGATVGWIHYLALDLLTGLWIARNADRHGYYRLVQIPILFFTLMAGPLGLMLYLLLRLFCKAPPENAVAPS
jgi:hypothetical protein